jgi:NAD(P)-dependent dehydrogenase (short-subunit alcohol dehydrogenase family)
MSRKVAFVTGASRGIGKSCCVQLARAGFDVALTARSVDEGEAREHSSTLKASNTKPLPGSLRSTAALVEAEGVEALMLPADLLDAASLGAAATRVLDVWGRVDALVHNGGYIGPGHMDLFLDTPIELLERQLRANVLAPLILDRFLLPGMLERGEGTRIGITSGAAYVTPRKPAGQGGFGLGYAISKGAFHRIAPMLATELGEQGIFSCNLQPGFIQTERMTADMAEFGFAGGAPPDVVGTCVAWIATQTEARARYQGENIEAQYLCHEHGLLSGWPGPEVGEAGAGGRFDLSAPRLLKLEETRRKELAGR